MRKPEYRKKGMNQTQYGKRIGVSQNRVSAMARADQLVHFADGSIDAEASDVKLRANMSPGRVRKVIPALPSSQVAPASEDGPVLTYVEARTINENLRARAAKLKLAKLKGSLIERELVERQVAEFVAAYKAAAVAFPVRNGPLLAGEFGVPEHAMIQRLEAMIEDLLREVSGAALRLG